MRAVLLSVLLTPALPGQRSIHDLDVLVETERPAFGGDWLVDEVPLRARVLAGGDERWLHLDNGLIRRSLLLAPNAATVAFDDRVTGAALLRAVRPEARVTLNGKAYDVGGLLGQPNHAWLDPDWLAGMTADSAAFSYRGLAVGPLRARMDWQRTRRSAPDVVWPPRGVELRMDYGHGDLPGVRVSVHYALYDGLPLLCKWLSVHNGTDAPLTVDGFTSEILAAVEGESRVEPFRTPPRLPPLHVETDFAFATMTASDGTTHCVHWLPDPRYRTQVNYRRQTPCLLEVRPTYGPAVDVAPGGTFTSFRTWILVQDPFDRERQGLAQRRMYRTIAPWVTENPLMMHVRSAEPDAVKLAIDQCAEVGFEMVILTFGSGFDIEDDSQENLDRWKALADYAHGKGIQLGGYSLLASRRISPDADNCVNPETGKPGGQRFGFAPALASDWGQRYFAKLYRFFEYTGFDLLEHDGSYPGDLDAAARPPLQKGVEDSRWVQWRIITDFYKWCRARGVYLNVPDWYYLSGSNKCGMGYRETNWSLPRAQQVIHTRQNIFDGTREKTPSMGWMFVPLTEYHGGGAAATIEPLHEHREHYGRMLMSNLGAGVQACYRGPRLYDTDAVREQVSRAVVWYASLRDILESDIIHSSSRRADGRDLDWLLHANPSLVNKGLLMVYNPSETGIERTLRIGLYYTGLTDDARVAPMGDWSQAEEYRLGREHRIELPVRITARGIRFFLIR